MKQPISACIMTKNEQDTIGNCVDSIRPYVEEIIVLDTGSEDATADIAFSKGAAVFHTVWQNDFSKVRNELIQLAKQPIVLIIDADEIAVPKQERAFSEIGKRLLSDESLVAKISILNETDDGISSASISRIFNKDSGIFFKGVVHEQIECSTKELKFIQSDIVLRHTGYLSSQIIANNKYERNLTLLFKELEKNNKNSYIHFQIGRTYSASGAYEKAAHHLNLAYKFSSDEYAYHSALIQAYGWALLRTKKFSELFELLQIGLQLYPDYTDLYFLYGCTLVELKSAEHVHLIPDIFLGCIELGEPDPQKYETVSGVGSFKAYYNLGLYYELTGQTDRAFIAYKNSAEADFKPAIERLTQLRT
ncbi:glycosyltransferase family 2 protein [Paenibacillus chitinolyticus]|uniref:Glycosyltransferase family 2 protein n=1 Tax=Paenibacillus chitinolyticus TaxID=79263 RepID=A0A410WQQ7_9BACL|nr:glycosyltransferase family 2 protein [Paenibacillus chitinolyticus]MCY9591685.1 glycosyltransferase family 2 protein [Paenibacillus chitinolyticus]MCY9596044.1 glycosyltransferase family 2 protein [Paenibacillus chitinolyticus]QAV16664.1 glycosyltransferase family 2 protein [Paenibacillus chitinolyticus]